MLCPHCSTAHSPPIPAECPCGETLIVLCRECGEPATHGKHCEVCAREIAAGEAREKRRVVAEGRGDWERDRMRGEP